MRHAPALGNVKAKQLRQLGRRLRGGGVAPSTKGRQQFSLRVKGQISVHHGADADGSDTPKPCAVLFLHVILQIAVAILKSAPHVFQTVRPDAVFQLVFPRMAARSDRFVIVPDQHRLDSSRSEFNAQNRFAVFYRTLPVHCLLSHLSSLSAFPPVVTASIRRSLRSLLPDAPRHTKKGHPESGCPFPSVGYRAKRGDQPSSAKYLMVRTIWLV